MIMCRFFTLELKDSLPRPLLSRCAKRCGHLVQRPLPHHSSLIRKNTSTFYYTAMHNDCAEVDELILELADYKDDYADVAAEKLLRKCSTSWEAYQYLQDRVHDAWIPDYARQQLRRIIKKIQVRLHQSREYSWAYD